MRYMREKIPRKRVEIHSIFRKCCMGSNVQKMPPGERAPITFRKYEPIGEEELQKLVNEGKIQKVEGEYLPIESERYKEFCTII